MDRFAAATGVTTRGGRRYLWTDAFAVCNWVGLGEVERAEALVERVHFTLGRHREDDAREGWISGLDEAAGAARPTAGGLRIGKPLPERAEGEPYDPELEWERDGQYFHYLTRWIRALDRMSGVTGDARYRGWAIELGRVAFDRFSHGIGPVPNRLYWKMSIDLSRPLIPSMGQHDPLDGYVVLSELQAGGGASDLEEAIGLLAGMAEDGDWATDDPLGAGSLLADAWFLASGSGDTERSRRLERVLDAGVRSVREVRDQRILELPAARRLPFRELGLAIGLAAVERLAGRGGTELPSAAARGVVAALHEATPLRAEIARFWLDERSRRAPTWLEHQDINTVMLATALAPDGYLGPEPG
ncbi:MAG: hypothetical protein ACOCVZ_02595 [Gemmatimonadota bacterium]